MAREKAAAAKLRLNRNRYLIVAAFRGISAKQEVNCDGILQFPEPV